MGDSNNFEVNMSKFQTDQKYLKKFSTKFCIGKSRRLFLFVFLLILLPVISAADFSHVIINSEDWKDVYSGMHYATLNDVQSDFLVSVNHAKLILGSISKTNDVMVLSSRDKPFAFNYPDMVESEGFSSAVEIESRDFNLELVNELPDIENFIVIDGSYGYSAIAVAPYAAKTNSWVFFADEYNVEEIDSILSSRQVKELIIYGYVDRAVRDTLETYSPTIINNEDKFEDNIEIVEMFMEISPTKQVLLTNGEFIEKELMLGTQPVLFTGRQNVPDQIRDYLKSSDIEIGVLIGNELLGAATNIRRSAGISVMVKFARGARAPGEGVSAVEGLDLFPLPTPSLGLEVYSVDYNTLTGLLEITYHSIANTQMYLLGTITVDEDGTNHRMGDAEPVFIAPGEYKTLTYELDLISYENLRAEIYTLFGEAKSALDMALSVETEIDLIDVMDSCDIDVNKVVYNKQRGEFEIVVKNKAGVACYVTASLDDLEIGYETLTLATENSVRIAPMKTETLIIFADLTDGDLENNNFVDLTLRYGEKETSLVKILNGRFEIKVSTLSTVTYVMVGAAAGGLIFFFLFFVRRRKEKEFNF